MRKMERSEKCLATMDADLPLMSDVYAWIDGSGELIVEYRKEEDSDGQEMTIRRAVVDADESRKMAAYYRVKVDVLPAVLEEMCGVNYATTKSVVERVFADALEVILESGAKYHFK